MVELLKSTGPNLRARRHSAFMSSAALNVRADLAVFVDAEHALDLNHAKTIGVDIDNLIVSQPDYGEQA